MTKKFRKTAGGAMVRTVPRNEKREDTTMFCWAYGSNLNIAQMKRRCPKAVPAGPMILKGGRLVFRGVADVVLEEGAIVPGGLWKITKECERELDAYEGIGSGLYVKRYFTIRRSKHVYKCLFYQMRDRGIMPPSEGYLATIAKGYKDFGLDPDYLNAAVEESWGEKKVTPLLKQRHITKGMPTLARDLVT